MRKAWKINRDKEGKCGEHKLTTVYEYGDCSVVYEYDSRCLDSARPNCFTSFDMLHIYKNGVEIASHRPKLDAYVNATENIFVMTSDGECWVYDFTTLKESVISMPIVAFDCAITFDRSEFSRRLSNVFLIYGSGCVWGCESDEQSFELYVDKADLHLVASKYVSTNLDEDDDDDDDTDDDVAESEDFDADEDAEEE